MSGGRARIAMGEAFGLWLLDMPTGFGEPVPHAHHAIQLTLALSGTIRLFDGARHGAKRFQAVAADHPHGFVGEGLVAFLFVEPESEQGRRLSRALFASAPLVDAGGPELVTLAADGEALFDATSDDEALLAWGRRVVARFAPATLAALPDPRVQAVVDHIVAHIEEPLDLSGVAAMTHLSPSRFRHLFVEQTGLGFKTYVLWRRLVCAVRRYGEGASLTDAAHAAGFADSAHFSRTFKRTFGLPATSLRRLHPGGRRAAGA